MPLSPDVVPLSILGLSQRSPRSGGVPGTLAKAENVIFEKGDQDGLLAQKRKGIGVIPGTGYFGQAIDQGYDIFDYNGNLTQLARNGAWTWVPSSQQWAKTGPQAPSWLSPKVEPAGPSYVDTVDACVSTNGYRGVAFQGCGSTSAPGVIAGVFFSLSIDGNSIVNNKLLDQDGCRPRVIATVSAGRDVIIVAWIRNAGGIGVASVNATLKWTSFDAATGVQGAVITGPTMAATQTLGTTIPYGFFDWGIDKDGNVLVAYNESTNVLKTVVIPASGGAAGAIVSTGVPAPYGGCLAASYTVGGYCDLVALNATDALLVRIDATTRLPLVSGSVDSAVGLPFVNVTGGWDQNTLKTWIAVESANATLPNAKTLRSIDVATVDETGTIVPGFLLKRSVGIASSVGFFVGHPVMLTCFQDTIPQTLAAEDQAVYQSTFHLLDLSTGDIVSKALVNQAGGLADAIVSNTDPIAHRCAVPHLQTVGNGLFVGSRRLVGEANSGNGVIAQYRQPVCLTFEPLPTSPPLRIDDVALTLGGSPQVFDGQTLAGPFLNDPPAPTVALQPGAILGVGQYQWRYCYKWTDATGKIYRSAPSPAFTLTTTPGNQTANVTYQHFRLVSGFSYQADAMTCNFPRAAVEVYRTSLADPKTFRLISTVDPYLANFPQRDSDVFFDNVDDTAQAAGQPLYTTGGIELSHSQPPPARVGAVWQRRMVLASLDEPGKLWISLEVVEGFGPQFAGELVFWLPGDPGEPRAMAVMDEKLIVWCERGTYIVYGQAPDNGGNGGTMTAQKVPAQFACLGPRLVDVTQDGAIYWGANGPWLMNRGLEQKFIGSPLLDLTSATPMQVIAGAEEPRTYVLTRDGQAMVYDHLFGAWSSFTKHFTVAACIWNEALAWIPFLPSPDGSARFRSTDYRDADQGGQPENQYISSRLAINDVTFGGVESFQAVWQAILLGEYVADHQLNVDVVYDYKSPLAVAQHWERATGGDFPEAYSSLSLYASLAPYAGSGDGVYQYVLPFKNPYCSALRLEIWDTPTIPSAPVYGGGFSLANIVFEVGLFPRSNRIKPGKRLG